jgi:hypothetical protein
MKTERYVMERLGVPYTQARNITTQAKRNLGLPVSIVYSKELEQECIRLCNERMREKPGREDDSTCSFTSSVTMETC